MVVRNGISIAKFWYFDDHNEIGDERDARGASHIL